MANSITPMLRYLDFGPKKGEKRGKGKEKY